MTTKEDVYRGFESIGKFVETIGNTIKENKRKQQVEKVLSQFQNPNKIFLNDDGTPKSDSEIAPMLNQGVMSLYQLGEDKLANSLTQYFGQMSKSFDKTSQNAFEYDYKSDGKYFPKQDGKPIAFNERVDYSGVRDEKEFAPQQPKPRFSYRVVNFRGPDGSGQIKYMKEDKITGETTEISASDYTKEIRESRGNYYSKSDFPAGPVKLSNGQYTEYDPDKGIKWNGKWMDVESFNKTTGLTPDFKLGTDTQEQFKPEDFFKAPQYNSFMGALEQAYKNKNISMADYNAAQDYITGKTTTYPERLYKLGFESQLNELRQKYLSQPK